MNCVNSNKYIKKFIYEDKSDLKDFSFYDDEDYLYYVFTNKIAKLLGDGELLPHHEFLINYKEKFCIFNDFEIDYNPKDGSAGGEKIYTTTYKIILVPSLKKLYSSFNIFIFTKIQ